MLRVEEWVCLLIGVRRSDTEAHTVRAYMIQLNSSVVWVTQKSHYFQQMEMF